MACEDGEGSTYQSEKDDEQDRVRILKCPANRNERKERSRQWSHTSNDRAPQEAGGGVITHSSRGIYRERTCNRQEQERREGDAQSHHQGRHEAAEKHGEHHARKGHEGVSCGTCFRAGVVRLR